MKEKINTYVQLLHGQVELNISVKENLKKQKGHMSNFGYIQVSTGSTGVEECFWDNLDCFIFNSFSGFKEECGKELGDKGFSVKQTYKSIKKLIKRASKLNLITA